MIGVEDTGDALGLFLHSSSSRRGRQPAGEHSGPGHLTAVARRCRSVWGFASRAPREQTCSAVVAPARALAQVRPLLSSEASWACVRPRCTAAFVGRSVRRSAGPLLQGPAAVLRARLPCGVWLWGAVLVPQTRGYADNPGNGARDICPVSLGSLQRRTLTFPPRPSSSLAWEGCN